MQMLIWPYASNCTHNWHTGKSSRDRGFTLNMEASCEFSYAGRAKTQMNTSWAWLLLQAILGLAANSMAID